MTKTVKYPLYLAVLCYNGIMMDEPKTATIEDMQKQISDLLTQVKYLTEQNNMLRHQLFGRKSERKIGIVPDGQLGLFDEAEAESDPAVPEPILEDITNKRKKSKGKRALDFGGLPTEQLIHELPDSERVCPACGGTLHACGHDVLRRELTIIPAQHKVTEHVQTVYSCRECEVHNIETPMIKSEVPSPVIPGSGIASPGLVAHIANPKYTLALPLYRQEQEFRRNNINLSRQTMANWIVYAAMNYLLYIYRAMKQFLLGRSVLHTDETVLQVLHEKEKPAESKSYIWLYRTGRDADRPIVLYDYQPNRKHENAKAFLGSFNGYLHSDGYQAYNNLPASMIVVGCWAHVRRKFADMLKSLPDYNKLGSLAMRGLEFCDTLFKLEHKYDTLAADDYFMARNEA